MPCVTESARFRLLERR